MVALAIAGMAQVRPGTHHPPVAGRGPTRGDRWTPADRGHPEPVGAPLPDIPGHVEQSKPVRRISLHPCLWPRREQTERRQLPSVALEALLFEGVPCEKISDEIVKRGGLRAIVDAYREKNRQEQGAAQEEIEKTPTVKQVAKIAKMRTLAGSITFAATSASAAEQLRPCLHRRRRYGLRRTAASRFRRSCRHGGHKTNPPAAFQS